MWASVLDIIASALPTVLGWFVFGKAQDGPSADYKAGEAAGALRTANDNQSKVLSDVEKARSVERAADSDRLRASADPLGPDKYRRD